MSCMVLMAAGVNTANGSEIYQVFLCDEIQDLPNEGVRTGDLAFIKNIFTLLYRREGDSWSEKELKGEQGSQGQQGDPGPAGADGVPGAAGNDGSQGPPGNDGAPGLQGDQGIQGVQGNPGAQGEQGIQGIQGNVGPQGDQGIQGPQGDAGPQGLAGIVSILRVHLAVPVLAALAWTNMPAALSFWLSSATVAKGVERIDLTGYTQVRLRVNKQGTSGAAASKLILRYRTTFTQAVADYSDIGTSEVSVAVNVNNTYLDSGWINLAEGAKADIFLALMGSGGDGALDPAFGSVVAEFK